MGWEDRGAVEREKEKERKNRETDCVSGRETDCVKGSSPSLKMLYATITLAFKKDPSTKSSASDRA